MYKNYLKITLRSLFKQRVPAFINIFGLSIGLASVSLFLLYAVHEFSFDHFHQDADRIYRVYRYVQPFAGRTEASADSHLPMPLGPAFAEEFPDVEATLRWRDIWGETFIRVNGKTFRETFAYVEPNFFEFFSFPIKYGDPESALSDPGNVVVSLSTAQQLFGEANPIGKQLEIQVGEAFVPFTVSAVAEDAPSNSSKSFHILGSFEYYAGTEAGRRQAGNWNSSFLPTFVKLRPGSGLADNAEALLSFRRKYYPDEEENLREAGYWTGEGAPATYKLQPLTDIHLNPDVPGSNVPPVASRSIWTLLAIAFGVLMIAVINFTTLSIGQSAGRAREVGIRKVIGSSRKVLVGQFLTEALLMSLLSTLIGLVMAQLLLPFFNDLAARELVFSFRQFPQLGLLIIGTTLVAGLLAGSYPALILSGFRPIEVLKNKIKLGGANWFTKALVTTQFALSAGLIIATLVIVHQLNFLHSKNPGFNKENVIMVDADRVDGDQIYQRFKQQIQSEPEIIGVAGAEFRLGANAGWSRHGFDYQGELKEIYAYYVDDDYLQVLGLELLAGRDFDPSRQDGANRSVIINERMLQDFGWDLETAIGQELSGYFDEGPQPKIIGVVKDFHYRSFSETVEAQLFHQFEDSSPWQFFVRFRAGDPAPVIASLEQAWKSVVTDYPFTYRFLDESLDQFYRSEEQFGQIISWAGGICILLACLGLLGLTVLATTNRQKEIGIRKVLGASVASIVRLFSVDFLKIVLIAILIAGPVAWYFMQQWLQGFAYRVELSWWIFALAAGAAIATAFLTISLQSIRAASVNPVNSLRNE